MRSRVFKSECHVPGSEGWKREQEALRIERLINPPLLRSGRDRGVYWERTGGKSHKVTFVREDEIFFRQIQVTVTSGPATLMVR